MSYPIELTFFSGKVKSASDTDGDNGYNVDNYNYLLEEKTGIVANGKEIWSTYDNLGLGLLCFRIGANSKNYSPEFHLKSYQSYSWYHKSDLVKLLRDLDSVSRAETGVYHLLFIRDHNQEEMNKGIVESLRKRIGLTLLTRIGELKPYQRFNWVLVAGRKPLSAPKVGANDGLNFKLPFQKQIAAWQNNNSCNRSNKGDAGTKGTLGRNKVTTAAEFTILGQSLSTNCAEVRLRF